MRIMKGVGAKRKLSLRKSGSKKRRTAPVVGRDAVQELESRYKHLPAGLRERLIKSELTGSVLQLRLSDISARNTYANAVSGKLYDSIQEKLVECYGESYGPLEFLTTLLRNTELPLSVRTKASVELLPYCNAKLATKDVEGGKAQSQAASGVLVVPGVSDRELWEKVSKKFGRSQMELENK